MPHETATLFFALLAVALAAGLVLLGVGVVVERARGPLLATRQVAVEMAAIVAVACTAGSLYLSEVAGFRPCRLCWVQRGFMYPAALLLIMALLTKRAVAVRLAGLLALLGLPVSLFHRYEQAAGDVGGLCDVDNPCSARWVEHFGIVTIPTMAAIGFAGVLSLVALQLFWRTQ